MPDNKPDTDQSAAAEAPSPQWPLFTSEAALSLAEARSLTGRRGATLVLLLGEVGVGKTTILVELWSQLLLHGSISGHSFAGSRTALAFEKRAHHSRVESRRDTAVTARSQVANDGFLHLRIRRPDGEVHELLLADFSGENFEKIREGTALVDQLHWAARVDRFLVVVDGKFYSTSGECENAMNRARRQIFALRSSGVVNATARIAIALTKKDELSERDLEKFSNEKESLLREVQSIDGDPSSLLVAARPANETTPQGLDDLIAWLCSDDRPQEHAPIRPPSQPSRAIGRFIP